MTLRHPRVDPDSHAHRHRARLHVQHRHEAPGRPEEGEEAEGRDVGLRQGAQAGDAKKDKEKEEKLKKQKPQMDQMRLKASTGRFKVVHSHLGPVHRSSTTSWLDSVGGSRRRRGATRRYPSRSSCSRRDHGPDLVVLPLVAVVRHPPQQAPGTRLRPGREEALDMKAIIMCGMPAVG